MKTTRFILLLIFPCFLLSMKCSKKETDHCHWRLYLTNYSDKSLYTFISYDYPDTSLNFQRPLFDGFDGSVPPNKRNNIRYDETHCIESNILDNGYEKLSVFIFDAAMVDTTPWPEVRQNYLVLKRLDYTLDELRERNFELEYYW
jgi:hypothetical protein